MNRTRYVCLVAMCLLLPELVALSEKQKPEQINWTDRVAEVKPGMKRLQVEKFLPQKYWGERQYGKDGLTETYWVDDQWVVTLFYQYDDIRDEQGKIVQNVGNNSLGKVLTLEQKKHPPAQIPKSEWTHAKALQLVLKFRHEDIKTLGT